MSKTTMVSINVGPNYATYGVPQSNPTSLKIINKTQLFIIYFFQKIQNLGAFGVLKAYELNRQTQITKGG